MQFRAVVIASGSTPNVVKDSYEWSSYLNAALKSQPENNIPDHTCGSVAVPVACFHEAPLADIAYYMRPDVKVEVTLNEDIANKIDGTVNLFWIAGVLKTAGYRVLVRFEGMTQAGDEVHDFWINLGSVELRHVGFAAEDMATRFLVPPTAIRERRADWGEYLMCQLHAFKTLPPTWPDIQQDRINNCKLKEGNRVELLDGVVSMRVRPALIESVTASRILVKVSPNDMNEADLNLAGDDDEDKDVQALEGVWMDAYSPLIFHVGWASKVGYQVLANDTYKQHAAQVAQALKTNASEVPYAEHDARADQMENFECLSNDEDENMFFKWVEGMKLEVLDPLDTWKELRVATVIDVMPEGYLKIGFDGDDMEEECIPLHCTSPLLFPLGYCEEHDLRLNAPKGDDKFDWKHHLKQTKSIAAPVELFENVAAHMSEGFQVGAKLEAVDMCEPQLICAATVGARKGRLLQIKYDGWNSSYDQLFDYRSNDIFPIGWCEMNGYKLEAPRVEKKKKSKGKK